MQPPIVQVGAISTFLTMAQANNLCMASESLQPAFPGNGGAQDVGFQFWTPGGISPCDAGSHATPYWNGALKDKLPYTADVCNGQEFIIHWDENAEAGLVLEFLGERYEARDVSESGDEVDGQSCNYTGHDCIGRNFFGYAYWPAIPGLCDGW